MKNGIVICSGGLDSVTMAHYLKRKLSYNNLIILFFDYGQRNLKAEKRHSEICAKDIGAKFIQMKITELGKISPSNLNSLSKTKEISAKDLKNTKKESKNWYVPCRNTIFIAYALALAESIFIKEGKKYDLFLGFKCEGKEPYPDTTPEFLKKMNELSRISCAFPIKVKAPLIKMDKEDIILLGKKLNVDQKKTFSCYTGKKIHCGTCLACRLRQQAFYWANVIDPTSYKVSSKP